MLILEACSNVSVLGTILFAKKLIKIISIVVPILLVLLITIDFAKAVVASSDDDMKRAQSLAIKRILAGLIVFFIPLLVDTAFTSLTDKGITGIDCYNKATESEVEKLVAEQAEKDKQKEEERQQNLAKAKERNAQYQANQKTLREQFAALFASSSSDEGTGATAQVCTNCTSSERIAQTAESLAYPHGTSSSVYKHSYAKNKKFSKWSQLNKTKPTQAFQNAYDAVWPKHWTKGCSKSYGCWPSIGASCDKFVFVSVKYSGYDKGIPTGLGSQISYLPKSAKWKKVKSAGRGDICIKSSHVKIYLGNNRQAEAGYKTKRFGIITSGNCSGYKVYRATS